MPFLKRAARFRAHAVACLANAEAADNAVTSRAHLAMAKHFYALAEQELSQREARRRAKDLYSVRNGIAYETLYVVDATS
ncbi:MAG: hypothetical protein WCD59_19680 [Pseudolabrys sp.]|jgi:hypothetical protein